MVMNCRECIAVVIIVVIVVICVVVHVACRYGVLAVLWGLLLLMVYKVAMIEKDYEEYDPFQILELAPVSWERNS